MGDAARKTLNDWLTALERQGWTGKRSGREWAGPCPGCGGSDRFHIRDRGDGAALVGCRGCMDGGQDPDGSNFREVLAAVFGDSRTDGRNSRPQDGRRRPPWTAEHPESKGTRAGFRPESGVSAAPAAAAAEARPQIAPESTFAARPRGQHRGDCPESATDAPAPRNLPSRLWSAGVSPDSSPARIYLTRRGVWPPNGDGFPALPPSVRWLRRGAAKPDPAARWFDVPAKAAGAALFRFVRPGAEGDSVTTVSMEALTQDGERLDWIDGERWRRTYGEKKGAAFVAARPQDPAALVLTEGEVSALAAVWLHPGAVVLATGGTAGLRGAAALAASFPALPVVIEADGDTAGRKTARDLAQALRLDGLAVSIISRKGGDAADDWREGFEERAGRFEADGMTKTDATAAAWRLALERMATDGKA